MSDTPLPGLEPPKPTATALETAVRRSIAALAGDDGRQIGPEQAARLALALEMAEIIGIKKQTGRLSTVGHDARVLVDLLDQLLPEAAADDVDGQLSDAMAEWAAMVQGGTPS